MESSQNLKINKNLIIIFAILLLFLLAGGIYVFSQKLGSEKKDKMLDNFITNKLKIEDVIIGKGTKEAINGKKVSVNYLGKLLNGTKFDSSFDRGVPFVFNLGAGQVIKGWDMGILGMKEGGKRILTIPPELGYGELGAPPSIPPNSTLVFEVELIKIEP